MVIRRGVAVFLIVAGLMPTAGRGEAVRVFATEVACAKDPRLGDATCRRAFLVARAIYESGTRSYPDRFGCYRVYGPCMPWPTGSAARFRPQLMGVSLARSGDEASAAPVLAPGRIRLALTPRRLREPIVAVATPSAASESAAGRPSEAAAALCRHIDAAALKANLPPAFLARLLWQESSFRAQAVSPAGALGIAQFMPGTAEDRGLADPFDPGEAIQSSAALLADLARQFGNLGLAAAAYNGGPARVAGWLQGRRTLAPETEAYVLRITGRTIKEWAAGRSDSDPLQPRTCLDIASRTPLFRSVGQTGRPGQVSGSIGSLMPTIPPASSANAR